MEEADILLAYERLREFATANGMQWVLIELDEAVALGVVEVKQLRQSTRRGEKVYEEMPAVAAGAPGRKRAEEFLSRRPMTTVERVSALLAALRRVLVDLDDVAAAAVEQVNQVLRDSSADEIDRNLEEAPEPRIVQQIDFEPDEGSPAVVTRIWSEGLRHGSSKETVAGILDSLERELLA